MYYVSICVLKPLWGIPFYVYMHFRQATRVTGDICVNCKNVLVLVLVLRSMPWPWSWGLVPWSWSRSWGLVSWPWPWSWGLVSWSHHCSNLTTRFMRVFAWIPWTSVKLYNTVWLSKTAIFIAFAHYFFGNFRGKANIIIWLVGLLLVPRRLSMTPKYAQLAQGSKTANNGVVKFRVMWSEMFI